MGLTRKIEWTTKSGKQATITVRLVTERTASADGDQITVKCCDLHIVGEVAGMGIVGYEIDDRPITAQDGTQYQARCGNLAIPDEQVAAVNAALAAVHATPEWQAHEAAKAKAVAETARYEAGREQMRRVMGY